MAHLSALGRVDFLDLNADFSLPCMINHFARYINHVSTVQSHSLADTQPPALGRRDAWARTASLGLLMGVFRVAAVSPVFPRHTDMVKQKHLPWSQGESEAKNRKSFSFGTFTCFYFPASFHISCCSLISSFLPPSPLNLLKLLASLPLSFFPSPCLGSAPAYTIRSIWVYGKNMPPNTQMFGNIWASWHPAAATAG